MRPMRLTTHAVTVIALALTLVAGGFAAWAGRSWYDAAHDDSAAYAEQRDRALAAGEQAVQNLNTLDHRDLDRGLDLWESSTTGELHDQLVDGRTEFAAQVKEAKTVTTAKVLSGAVTELDDRAGRARVLVALRVTVRTPGEASTDKDSRLLGELTRTDGRWKLSALGQAPVGGTPAG
ncbi:nuclear transport factor 2 family protein [Streptomyces broussonetiae]|uniref:Nuclear transport factor 2 family protein n=1 Tax=Streptomyces broussonetiae TaxID=2686304 RepID=A0ABV5E8Y0_9ACTN